MPQAFGMDLTPDQLAAVQSMYGIAPAAQLATGATASMPPPVASVPLGPQQEIAQQMRDAAAPDPAVAAHLARINAANANPYLPADQRYTGPGAILPPEKPTSSSTPPADEPGLRGWLVKQGMLRPEAEANASRGASLVAPGVKPNGDAPDTTKAPSAGAPIPGIGAPGAVAPTLARPMGMGAPRPNPALAHFDRLDALDKQTIDAQEGARDANAAASQAQDDLAYGAQAATQNALDSAAHIQRQQDEHARITASNMDEYRSILQSKMDALQGVDPDHWWNSKSTGQKIGLGLAAALGAFGAAMPHTGGGGKNPAMELIQGAIDNDIKAQHANLDGEWKKLTQGMALQKDKEARAQWEQDRMDKAKAEAYEKAKLQTAGYAQQATSAQAKAQLAAVGADITKAQDATLAGMEQRRFSFLQASAAASNPLAATQAALLKDYPAYVKSQEEKGLPVKSPSAYVGGALAGTSNASGAPGGAPVSAEERQKAAQYGSDLARIKSLGAAAMDPKAGPLDRSRARDVYNAAVTEFAHQYGAPGRQPEQIQKTVEPALLSANPLQNDAQRVGNVDKIIGPPRAFVPPAAPAALGVPGMVPVRR